MNIKDHKNELQLRFKSKCAHLILILTNSKSINFFLIWRLKLRKQTSRTNKTLCYIPNTKKYKALNFVSTL